MSQFLTDQDSQDIACYRLLVAIEAALNLCYHIAAKKLKKVPEEYAECFAILGKAMIITPQLSKNLQKHDLVLSGTDIRPDTPVSSFARLIAFFQDTDNCLFILATFLKKRGHIVIVKDSAGRITGLVTLEDILETILGAEIVDEKDRFVDLQKVALR